VVDPHLRLVATRLCGRRLGKKLKREQTWISCGVPGALSSLRKVTGFKPLVMLIGASHFSRCDDFGLLLVEQGDSELGS